MGVSHKEATAFSEGDTATWKHLKAAVLGAVGGYQAVLDSSRLADLVPRLNSAPLELRGYAYEGAAMGLTGLDCFLPWKSRLKEHMAGPGAPHIYTVHIGAGEAFGSPAPQARAVYRTVRRWRAPLAGDGWLRLPQGVLRPQARVDEQVIPARRCRLQKSANRWSGTGLRNAVTPAVSAIL